MCAPISTQALGRSQDGEFSKVSHYSPDGVLITEDESICLESNAFKEDAPPRYQWTGRELPVETLLEHNRARCFDPSIGHWLNGDPLGFESGESNLHPYIEKSSGN